MTRLPLRLTVLFSLAVVEWCPAQTAAPGSASPGASPAPAPIATVPAGGPYVIVSVTALGASGWDVRMRNPRTGYFHSLTIHDGGDQLRPGQQVMQNTDGTLAPTIPAGNAPPPDQSQSQGQAPGGKPGIHQP